MSYSIARLLNINYGIDSGGFATPEEVVIESKVNNDDSGYSYSFINIEKVNDGRYGVASYLWELLRGGEIQLLKSAKGNVPRAYLKALKDGTGLEGFILNLSKRAKASDIISLYRVESRELSLTGTSEGRMVVKNHSALHRMSSFGYSLGYREGLVPVEVAEETLSKLLRRDSQNVIGWNIERVTSRGYFKEVDDYLAKKIYSALNSSDGLDFNDFKSILELQGVTVVPDENFTSPVSVSTKLDLNEAESGYTVCTIKLNKYDVRSDRVTPEVEYFNGTVGGAMGSLYYKLMLQEFISSFLYGKSGLNLANR